MPSAKTGVRTERYIPTGYRVSHTESENLPWVSKRRDGFRPLGHARHGKEHRIGIWRVDIWKQKDLLCRTTVVHRYLHTFERSLVFILFVAFAVVL